MYQWDLLETETGWKLDVSRPQYRVLLLGVATAIIMLLAGYSSLQTDFIPRATRPILLASLLIPTIYVLFCFWRLPFQTIFSADVNISAKTIIFLEQKARDIKTRSALFSELTAIDAIIWTSRFEPNTQYFRIRFRFTDGTQLCPLARDTDQNGQIRWIIGTLRDLTGMSGEEVTDPNPSPEFRLSLWSLRLRRW